MPPTKSNNPKIVATIFPVLPFVFGFTVCPPELVGDGAAAGVDGAGFPTKLLSDITTDSSGTEAFGSAELSIY